MREIPPPSSSPNPSAASSDSKAGVPFVFPVVLLFATILQSRAADLWSESRIIRKLRAYKERREDGDIADHMIGPSGRSQRCIKEQFSKLYISLSKGRHRGAGRTFKFLFVVFFFLFDFADYWPLLRDDGYLSDSDVVVGMRMMLYVGSFSVLGARVLTLFETASVFLICLLYGCSLWFLGGKNLLRGKIGLRIRVALLVFRTGALAFQLLIFEIPEFLRNLACSSTNIADIANAIRAGTFNSNQAQIARFEDMYEHMHRERADMTESAGEFIVPRGEKGGRYWPWKWCRFTFLPSCVFCTSGVLWHVDRVDFLATLVIIEMLECLSWMLFVINDTQVEPRLFVELLKIADSVRQAAASPRPGMANHDQSHHLN